MEIAEKTEGVKPVTKTALKTKETLANLLVFMVLITSALIVLVLIDRWLFVALGLENPGLKLSPLFILLSSLIIRTSFKKIVCRREIQKRTKIAAAVLVILVMVNAASSFVVDREAPNTFKFSSLTVAQSAASSLPDILLASLPYIGIPLSVCIQTQRVAEERAISLGKDSRDISGADLLNALFIPPW